MEKRLPGVRNRQLPGKRRRKAAAYGADGGLAKAITAYLSSDSYLYAPLVCDPQAPPPPAAAAPTAAAPAAGSSEKEVTPVKTLEAFVDMLEMLMGGFSS